MQWWENVGTIIGVISGALALLGLLVRWVVKQAIKWVTNIIKPILDKLDSLHESVKTRAKENGIIFRALLGIIDCLETQQVNGNLSKAKKEINEYLTDLED
jgi:hypothetical protein